MSILVPPLFYGIYAITKYQLAGVRLLPTMVVASLAVGGLVNLGLSSSNRDINNYYRLLYEQYRDEVLRPQYRGLKLYNGKKAY